jgi:hypothetical protein
MEIVDTVRLVMEYRDEGVVGEHDRMERLRG